MSRQKVEIDFQSHDVPADLPADRVSFSIPSSTGSPAQCREAQWGETDSKYNSTKSQMRFISRSGILGKGFDVAAAQKGRGLGLTSMQERVRVVNGKIAIESKPMGGTTIHVRVPFGSEK